jgi:hypothetical protein
MGAASSNLHALLVMASISQGTGLVDTKILAGSDILSPKAHSIARIMRGTEQACSDADHRNR